MRTPTIILALALAFGVNGAHATPQPKACELIPAATASKILGKKVTAHAINSLLAGPDAASMCNYSTGKISGGFMLLAGRVHYTNAAQEIAVRKKEALSDTPPGMGKPVFMDVKGLGEAAYVVKMPGYFQLHVLDHGAAVVINMNHAADSTSIKHAKQLAQVALQHLR